MDEDEFNVEALTRHKADKDAQARAAAIKAAQGDPELEAILLETQQVRKETLDSTGRSARMIKETIVVADKTNEKLTAQGEQLERISETATRADQNADESYKHAKNLHKYKGLTPWSLKNVFKGKDKKNEDRKLEQARLEHERASASGQSQAMSGQSPATSIAPGPKKHYADESEAQIDQNLDDISAGLGHLKASGLSMQQKMREQENTMQYIDSTTVHTTYTLDSAGRKIKEFE